MKKAKPNIIKFILRKCGAGILYYIIFLLFAAGCSEVNNDTVLREHIETGPFTVKLRDSVSKIMTEQGREEPFIVISKVGNEEVTADTPTPVKANAGIYITLKVTVPDTHIVTNFKVNDSIAPQKISADGVSPAEYKFKMPSASSTINGTLTLKTSSELIKIESVFDNTLQELYIAQGELSLNAKSGPQSNQYGRLVDTLKAISSWGSAGGGSGGQPSENTPNVFAANIMSYTASVPFSGYPAVITAIPRETEAGIKIEQTKPDGGGVFTVAVTVTAPFWKLYPDYKRQDGDPELPQGAESNKTNTYTITVTRGAGDKTITLNSLIVPQTQLNPSFDGESIYTYAGTVAANVDKLNISAAAKHPNARLQLIYSGATEPQDIDSALNSVAAEIPAPDAGMSGGIKVKVIAEDTSETKEYTINIFRENQQAAAPVYNANGGIASIKKIDGIDYEIHEFLVKGNTAPGASEAYTLSFVKKPAGGAIELLVVGGGGAGGSVSDILLRGGGGGAGGFVYVPDYKVDSGDSFAVKVGAGGASVPAEYKKITKSKNGADSAFGANIVAYGGGGAGNHTGGEENNADSSKGGSGGGGTYRNGGKATKGIAIGCANALILGNAGGNALQKDYSAAGGGGAKGAGVNITVNTGSHYSTGSNGGSGTLSAISGAEMWYAGGGAGGAEDAYNNGPQYGAGHGNSGEAHTGDGGSGAGIANGKLIGGNGGSGIVIARWPYNKQ
jgi:hypothetical protein